MIGTDVILRGNPVLPPILNEDRQDNPNAVDTTDAINETQRSNNTKDETIETSESMRQSMFKFFDAFVKLQRSSLTHYRNIAEVMYDLLQIESADYDSLMRGNISRNLFHLLRNMTTQDLASRDTIMHVTTFFAEQGKVLQALLAHNETFSSKFQEGLSRPDKMISAKVNQQLALQFYADSLLPIDQQATELLMDLVYKAKSTEQEGRHFSNLIPDILGASAQSALMRVFTDSGYTVLTPDPNDVKEIRLFDLTGVDLIVVDPKGILHFIDAKGWIDQGSVHVARSSTPTDHRSISYCRQNLPRDIRVTSVEKWVITLPTGHKHLDGPVIHPKLRGKYSETILTSLGLSITSSPQHENTPTRETAIAA